MDGGYQFGTFADRRDDHRSEDDDNQQGDEEQRQDHCDDAREALCQQAHDRAGPRRHQQGEEEGEGDREDRVEQDIGDDRNAQEKNKDANGDAGTDLQAVRNLDWIGHCIPLLVDAHGAVRRVEPYGHDAWFVRRNPGDFDVLQWVIEGSIEVATDGVRLTADLHPGYGDLGTPA